MDGKPPFCFFREPDLLSPMQLLFSSSSILVLTISLQAERPPPSQKIHHEILMAADEDGDPLTSPVSV
jgi:hypothetical protein